MAAATLPILAATGLRAEARIAAGPGVVTVAGGGDPARFALLLQGALLRGVRGVVSFGIAGGLDPALKPGTVVVGRSVGDGTRRLFADAAWLSRLAARLPDAVVDDLAGADAIVAGTAAKRRLREATGAAAVDMESHIAARLAAQHRVPFVALRVVADPASRALPHAATVGMRPDGTTDAAAVLASLARRPGDIPALIRTALDARAAFAALGRCRAALVCPLGLDPALDAAAVSAGAAWDTAQQAALFAPGEVQPES